METFNPDPTRTSTTINATLPYKIGGTSIWPSSNKRKHREDDLDTGVAEVTTSVLPSQALSDSLTVSIESRVHVQKKPKLARHVCTICNTSYHRLKHLKRHERSHINARPFGCPYCSKCFTKIDQLSRHQRVMHPCDEQKCIILDISLDISNCSTYHNALEPQLHDPKRQTHCFDDQSQHRLDGLSLTPSGVHTETATLQDIVPDTRSDLVYDGWSLYSRIDRNTTYSEKVITQTDKQRKRHPQACDACRIRKIKCNARLPRCTPCQILARECTYYTPKPPFVSRHQQETTYCINCRTWNNSCACGDDFKLPGGSSRLRSASASASASSEGSHWNSAPLMEPFDFTEKLKLMDPQYYGAMSFSRPGHTMRDREPSQMDDAGPSGGRKKSKSDSDESWSE